jgi:hypothetical protein
MSIVHEIDRAIASVLESHHPTIEKLNTHFNPAVATNVVGFPPDIEDELGLRTRITVDLRHGRLMICRYDSPAYTHSGTGAEIDRIRKYTVELGSIAMRTHRPMIESLLWEMGDLKFTATPSEFRVTFLEPEWEKVIEVVQIIMLVADE